MKVEFTKDQYERLIKLTFLGERFINSVRLPEDFDTDYEKAASYIYSKAEEFGLDEFVEKGKEDLYYPSMELEEDPDLSSFREEYNEENFWEELLYKLVDKDMLDKYGVKALEEMSIDERINKEDEFFELWDEELTSNGLEGFNIKGAE